MSRAAGLASSTGRAIIQGEIQETTNDKIAALLMTFMSVYDTMSLIEKYSDKPLWIAVKKEKIPETQSTQVQGFQWEYPDHLIMGLATLVGGVATEIMERAVGTIAAKRVRILLDAGFLREINGRIHLQSNAMYFSDILDSVAKARMHASAWTAEDMNSGGYLYHYTLGLSEEGCQYTKELSRKYLADLLEAEAKFPGNERAMVISLICNALVGNKV